MSADIQRTSRLPGFYDLTPAERRQRLIETGWLIPADADLFPEASGFNEAFADAMIENVIGTHGLPLACALNFRINGEDRLIPLAVEEPSIVAACSFAAKLFLSGGGLTAHADPPLLAAQIQLLQVGDAEVAIQRIHAHERELLESADRLMPQMKARGVGLARSKFATSERACFASTCSWTARMPWERIWSIL